MAKDTRRYREPWITVRHNGVKIHDRQDRSHATTASPPGEGPEYSPIYLRDHGNRIRFRNIRMEPIKQENWRNGVRRRVRMPAV